MLMYRGRHNAEDRPRRDGRHDGQGSHEAIARVTHAFLAMKKFDIAALERAYQGV
jgi:hypothetical protein